MRLYSRGQVFLISLSSVIIIAALALGFGLLRLPGMTQPESSSVESIPAPVDFELSTNNTPPEEVQPVNWEDRFSSEELENIRIYETVNEGGSQHIHRNPPSQLVPGTHPFRGGYRFGIDHRYPGIHPDKLPCR